MALVRERPWSLGERRGSKSLLSTPSMDGQLYGSREKCGEAMARAVLPTQRGYLMTMPQDPLAVVTIRQMEVPIPSLYN